MGGRRVAEILMNGRGGRGLGEVRGGLEGGEVREGSVTTVRTTVGTLHVIGVYTPVERTHAHHCTHGLALHIRSAWHAKRDYRVASTAPLALCIRHMGTPFELRAFAMAFGTCLVRFQKNGAFPKFWRSLPSVAGCRAHRNRNINSWPPRVNSYGTGRC